MRILSLLLPLTVIPAWSVALTFSSLPSAQGWTFTGSGVTEAANVSIGGGVLSINTIGTGEGSGWYGIGPALSSGTSYLVFEARLLSNEGSGYPEFGFGFGVYSGGAAYVVGLGQGYVKGYQGSSATIDTSVFQTYVLAVNHDLQSYVLSVDGNPLLNGTPVVSVGDAVIFGDLASGGNNANGELRLLSYGTSQFDVPEPSTGLLVLSALAVLATRKRRALSS